LAAKGQVCNLAKFDKQHKASFCSALATKQESDHVMIVKHWQLFIQLCEVMPIAIWLHMGITSDLCFARYEDNKA